MAGMFAQQERPGVGIVASGMHVNFMQAYLKRSNNIE
jgi:hypothetical protein